jgi:inhibitor of KinA
VTRIVALGDAAVALEFEARIDAAVNARVLAAAAAIRRAAIAGVLDVVPAYASLTVYFDPLRAEHAVLRTALARAAGGGAAESPRGRLVHVPVCYGAEFGPDLEAVGAFGGVSAEEVVARHTARAYRVFMLGFVPGFAYLGVVDERIAAPRRAAPRPLVPAGSVGIAGLQTGVYPSDTPGGWQIIGRTPVRMFDLERADPSRLAPGDEVRFERIDRAAFDRLRREER